MSVSANIQNARAAEANNLGSFSVLKFSAEGNNDVKVFIEGENHATIASCMAEYFNDHLEATKPPPAPVEYYDDPIF